MKTIKLNTKGIIHHLVIIIVAVVVAVSAIGVGVYEYANSSSHKSHAAGWTNLGGINGNTLTWACYTTNYLGNIGKPLTNNVSVLLISHIKSRVWIAGYAGTLPAGTGGNGGWTGNGWTPFNGGYILETTIRNLAQGDHVAVRVANGGVSNVINIGGVSGTSFPWSTLDSCQY